MITALRDQGEISLVGTVPREWLGVPLMSEDRRVGVLAVQNRLCPRLLPQAVQLDP